MEHHAPSFFADPRLWVAVAFTAFFLIFGRKLFGPLLGILDKRAADIRAELDEAARLRREAEAMLADAKAQRETALRDAETMLSQARSEAVRVAETARTDAAAAATRRERLAMERIAAAEKAAVTDVRLAAAEIAARAAQQVIATDLGAEADARLVDNAIQGLPAALASRRAA
jgi:F-type H+-transporting ATPase subunit b